MRTAPTIVAPIAQNQGPAIQVMTHPTTVIMIPIPQPTRRLLCVSGSNGVWFSSIPPSYPMLKRKGNGDLPRMGWYGGRSGGPNQIDPLPMYEGGFTIGFDSDIVPCLYCLQSLILF